MSDEATSSAFDLAVIGGGINGTGVAADAAGRGLKVLLVEQGDLAGATSSASSKLIHGGLRYLEHYEFRLVHEALAEREVLLARAPHIIWPLRFVLPHVAGLRPRWMIRAGLFLYDNLYRRKLIPGSSSVDLTRDPAGRALAPGLTKGFAYWDCWVDDARLVVLNAEEARRRGAEVLVGTRLVSGIPGPDGWRLSLAAGDRVRDVRARAVVNAAGPWADLVAESLAARGRNQRAAPKLRLVKGSHIVVPAISEAGSAYLLQSADRRVVFAIPFEERFTLIGTTDVPFEGEPGRVAISPGEQSYLLELAGRFFARPPKPEDIVWSYAGVRPLYDDESDNPSAVTRDWRLELDTSTEGAPLLSVIGGKVTTYRRLAEAVLARLAPFLPGMGPSWTAAAKLPGGDLGASGLDGFVAALVAERPGLDAGVLRRLARRYGSETRRLIAEARTMGDLGRDLGAGLTEREVAYLAEHEWARSADDVLWRRTKAGLHMGAEQRRQAGAAIEAILARSALSR